MAKRLLKRTAPEAPKPLPARSREAEPETTVGKGAENVPVDRTPALGYCKKCKAMPAHSEVDKLCYNCHQEAAGFEFDAEKLRWIKKTMQMKDVDRAKVYTEHLGKKLTQ